MRHRLLFILIFLVSCSEVISESVDTQSVNKNYGKSAKLAYDCVTSTIDSNGKKWTYKVGFISNLQPSVSLLISSSQSINGKNQTENFGSISLNKIDTDTFSDRHKATVKLIQNGANKSIEVSHHSKNLLARKENGWCRTLQLSENQPEQGSVPTYTIQKASSVIALNGLWQPDTLLNPQQGSYLKFDANMGWANTRDQILGQIGFQGVCNHLIDLGANEYTAGKAFNTPETSSRLLALLDAIGIFVELYRGFRCAQNPNLRIERMGLIYWKSIDWEREPIYVGTAHDPKLKFKLCADRVGSKFLVGELIAGDYSPTGYLCIKHYPTTGNTREFIEVKAVDKTGLNGSDWLRFTKR